MKREHQYIWWEKTVEHLFVMRAVKSGLSIYAPLAGDHEQAGDMVFSRQAKFVLIEFKRSRAEVPSEKSKYSDYAAAREALRGSDAHHVLVYGRVFANELDLQAETYFSSMPLVDALDALQSGVTRGVFDRYLKKLLFHKSKNDVLVPDYSSVLAIDSASGRISLIPSSEYKPFPPPGQLEVSNTSWRQSSRRRLVERTDGRFEEEDDTE